MADNQNLTVIALANATNAGRSATGERLRQLAERGVVEKSATGRWRLKGEAAGPMPPPSP
jgi:DNA-binding IclR family transcriptional regulator